MDNLISRKKFLRTCGTILAGGTVAGVSGALLSKSRSDISGVSSGNLRPAAAFSSPYRQIA
jgi:hypothetical protein